MFCLLLALCDLRARGADTLTWHTNDNRVSADIKSTTLPRLLAGVAQLTGWQVFLEPNVTLNVSAKFKDRTPAEALQLLLGDLNYALLPQTNSRPRLYVFRTGQERATTLLQPAALDGKTNSSSRIKNELVVTLKPGSSIDDLARKLGAKVIGRDDAMNTYLLKFGDEAAADSARDSLADNSDVKGIDSNFSMAPPIMPQVTPTPSLPDLTLKPRPAGDHQIMIGVLDTAVGTIAGGADSSVVLPSLTVADGAQPSDTLTHGPAMVETMLEALKANSPDGTTSVKIQPVDVYGGNISTSTFDVALGIPKAINAGANIINMSLGSDGDSTYLHRVIENASQQGVVFFAAAGNDPVTTPTYPAAYPEVNGVTASQNGQLAPYANRGDFVSLIAPGTSLVPFDGQSYMVTGTSTSSASVSGIAAALADSAHVDPAQVVPTIRSKMGFQAAPSH